MTIKDKIIIKGHKIFEKVVSAFNDKFKKLIGKELGLEEKVEEKSSQKGKEMSIVE